MKKRLSVLLLGIFMLLACCPRMVAAGSEIMHRQEAQYLVDMGILKGTGQGLELDQPATRVQSTVLLVRLLGQEDYALNSVYRHPFNDLPVWADAYVAFLYNAYLCNGIGPHSFSPQGKLDASQYITMLLRALGYRDDQGDFSSATAMSKAVQIGLITPQEKFNLENSPAFKRNELIYLSYRALQTRYKESACTLGELVSGKAPLPGKSVLWKHPGQRLVVRFPGYDPESPNFYEVRNYHDLYVSLHSSLWALKSNFKIVADAYTGDLGVDFPEAVKEAVAGIDKETGLIRLLKSWRYEEDIHGIIHVNLDYYHTPSQFLMLEKKVLDILNMCITPSMSQCDQEKALHDYIVNHAFYDYDNMLRETIPQDSYSPYGVLVLGRGVCQGYAEAMHLLCTQAGLDSLVIFGSAQASGEWITHAWNLINIEGSYYHVDVSWDDITIGAKERLRHTYFNLPDSDINLDHRWMQADYPSCSSTRYNYFVLNGQVVTNYNDFTAYVDQALNNRQEKIEVKIKRFKTEQYEDLSTVMFKKPYVQRYCYNIDERQGVVSIYDIVYH